MSVSGGCIDDLSVFLCVVTSPSIVDISLGGDVRRFRGTNNTCGSPSCSPFCAVFTLVRSRSHNCHFFETDVLLDDSLLRCAQTSVQPYLCYRGSEAICTIGAAFVIQILRSTDCRDLEEHRLTVARDPQRHNFRCISSGPCLHVEKSARNAL